MDNGIKFFDRKGFKLADEVEHSIEDLTFTGRIDDVRPTADAVGKASRIDDVAGRYIEFLKGTVPRGFSLEGLKMVVDGAHGAGYRVGPALFRELGAEVTTLGVTPNGTNINEGVGSTHPETAAALVRETGADIGVCLDGDADRCLLIDGNGEVVSGDHVLAICGIEWQRRGQLPNNSIVATVMSNLGLDIALREVGIELLRTPVGDRHVVERMRTGGHCIGGEQSGHTVFLDYNSTGDGLLTALQTLRVVVDRQRSLADLADCMQALPQVLHNIDIAERRPIEELPSVMAAIGDVEATLGDRGRVLVRYSGTQPMARVMIEGEDQAQIEAQARDIVNALRMALQ
jgi:phosphoglucosamine mutase